MRPQGWHQKFSDGDWLPTRGLKYGFQGTMNVKILQKISFSFSDGMSSMFRRGVLQPPKARFIVRNFSDNFLRKQKITGLAPDCLPTNPH